MRAEEVLKKFGYSYTLQKVPLKIIRKDEEIYPRVATDFEAITMYLSALKSGEELPPIVLTKDYEIVDGYHRYSAMYLYGAEEIDALVLNERLSMEQIFSLAVELNIRHGKRLLKKDFERIKKKYLSSKFRVFMSQFVKEMVNINESGDIGDLDKDARWVDEIWADQSVKEDSYEEKGSYEKVCEEGAEAGVKGEEKELEVYEEGGERVGGKKELQVLRESNEVRKEGKSKTKESKKEDFGFDTYENILRSFERKVYSFYTSFLKHLKKDIKDREIGELEGKVLRGAELLFALSISLLREFYVLSFLEEARRGNDIKDRVLEKLNALFCLGERFYEEFRGVYGEEFLNKFRSIIDRIEKGVEK